MKKLIDGLLFGLGFGIAILAVTYIGFSSFLVPSMTESNTFEASPTASIPDAAKATASATPRPDEKQHRLPFHELSIDDQIKHSTVIALAEYQPGPDGSMRPIISDILKKEDGVEFYYDVGDEYARGTYYPGDRVVHGEGMVIFFTGSPASMRSSMNYNGERITGLGDMPLKLLRKKCEAPAT